MMRAPSSLAAKRAFVLFWFRADCTSSDLAGTPAHDRSHFSPAQKLDQESARDDMLSIWYHCDMQLDPVHDINWALASSPGAEILYKFRSARDDRHKAALSSGKLYIGEALALNDPFDSKPKEFLRRDTAEEANAYREAVRRLRVLCFSGPFKGDGDDVLRWSHYGDGHAGYCLMIRDPNLVAQMRPVEYLPSYPSFADLTPMASDFWHRVGFFKARCWTYEDERRVLFPSGSDEEYTLSAGAIWGVTFGCWSIRTQRDEIAQLAMRNNPACFFFHASMVESSFSLRYSNITPEYHPVPKFDVQISSR